MANIINRRDLDFLLFDWLGIDALQARPRFAQHGRADIGSVLDLAEKIARDVLAPHHRASDTTEPFLDAEGQVHVLPEVARGVRAIAEAGLFGAVFDEALGGSQLPHIVHVAMMGLLMSANIATASYLLLSVANARLIASYGTPAQVSAFALPQIEGATLGTMCLSEPHAGSSLADIRTRAEPDGEDEFGPRYRLHGSKMWISAGDQDISDNIVHLVLAKILNEGTQGISLFIVPKVLPGGGRNDVTVVGLNHKMGYRGIPNCALNFGEGATQPLGRRGAVGWRVGEPGRGLAQMFQMMNEARISVGLGGAMLAYRGFLLSLDYARERTQGRPWGTRDGDPVAIVQHPDVKRMLLAQKCYAEGALALVLYSARLLDEVHTAPSPAEREVAEELLALLTPITKTWPSEWAQVSLHHAIQIHGAAGYTRDFEVELLYRDNRLNPIHEGTTGIQGIDLLGRKIWRDKGRAFSALEARVSATLDAARRSGKQEVEANAVTRAWATLAGAVRLILDRGEPIAALPHATNLLEAMGHAVLGWLWLDQTLHCVDAATDFQRGKLHACRYFAEYELPKVDSWLAPLMAGSDLLSQLRTEEIIGE